MALPSVMEMVLISLVNMLDTAMVSTVGTDAVAANSIASVVRELLVCVCRGVGSGGAILVGNELGAGRKIHSVLRDHSR